MIQSLVQSVYPGRWWIMLPDGRIECRLCPRFCKLNEGQRGFCFVRQRVGDEMVLTTYGRSSGFCVDPIEKKPLNHFLPGTSVLSFGTAGCNLGCRFCQNWDISKAREWDKLADAASAEQIAMTAWQAGCRSVAFTYNDPVIFAEYAIDVAQACRERGIKTVAVTAGYITEEARPEFYRHMDAANVDLKAFTDTFYHRLCFAQLDPVLDTLKYLRHETNVWFEVTPLLIPGENDSDAELHLATDWFAENLGPDVPWHFTAFHPDFKMMDKPHTPPATLSRARKIARSKGLHYVYTGNVHDSEGGSTWCPSCGELLIERDWFELGDWNLEDGKCRSCGYTISGRFEDVPGRWGARRMPIRLTVGCSTGAQNRLSSACNLSQTPTPKAFASRRPNPD
jgi:pyruvate formate lyase activating enzyme